MMNQDDRGCSFPDTGAEFLNDLTKSINAEYSAIICYEQLAKMAPSSEEKERIMEIRDDEIRHFESFSRIYSTLTGRKHEPRQTEECAKNYCKGLAAFFKDEQETVDSYLEIAAKAFDPHIKEEFRRAAADEQNHAVWFAFFYFKNN